MKKTTLLAPLAAAVLVLSACGGNDAGEPTIETAAPSAAVSEGATEAAPEEGTAAEPETEDSDAAGTTDETSEAAGGESVDVQAAVDAFIAAHEGAQQIPAEQLDMSASQQMTEGVEIDPAECQDALAGATDPQLFDDAELGGAVQTDATGGSSLAISVAKFPDTAQGAELIEMGRNNVQQCGNLTMTIAGQEVETTLEALPGSVVGAQESFLSTQTVVVGGQPIVNQTGVATVGDLHLTVVGTNVEASAVQEALEKTIAGMS